MGKYIDLTGKRFGRLFVLSRDGYISKQPAWLCRCDCGVEKRVSGPKLRSGKTRSCGCLRRELVTASNLTHNLTGTRLYYIWSNMRNRCENMNNEKWASYGGRGIRVCDEWHDSSKFFEWALNNGYNDSLTIDRINVNGNYEPLNCRWATTSEQALNRTDNHYLTYNGTTQTMKEWSDQQNIPYKILEARINRFHWDVERALTQPVRKHSCSGNNE